MVKRLAAEEGLVAGSSSGAAVFAAVELARELGPGKRIATIISDSAERYLSKKIFEGGACMPPTPPGKGRAPRCLARLPRDRKRFCLGLRCAYWGRQPVRRAFGRPGQRIRPWRARAGRRGERRRCEPRRIPIRPPPPERLRRWAARPPDRRRSRSAARQKTQPCAQWRRDCGRFLSGRGRAGVRAFEPTPRTPPGQPARALPD